MKRFLHKYQLLSIAMISVGILFLPGYALFDNLCEINFLRSTLNWENPDDIDQSASLGEKWKVAQVNVYSILFVPEDRIFDSIAPFVFGRRLSKEKEKASVLRC